MLTFLKDLKSTRGLLSPVFSEVLQNFRTRRNLRYFGSQGFHQQLHLEASLSPLCSLSVGERLNPPEEGGIPRGPVTLARPTAVKTAAGGHQLIP